jgi:hypothetical protein
VPKRNLQTTSEEFLHLEKDDVQKWLFVLRVPGKQIDNRECMPQLERGKDVPDRSNDTVTSVRIRR